jgi:hypothetical protein
MVSVWRNRYLPARESASAATDLDLISQLKAVPDVRMRRGVRIPAWHLLLVAVLGILSRCQSLRDLEPPYKCQTGSAAVDLSGTKR